jgi:hypothetical protein
MFEKVDFNINVHGDYKFYENFEILWNFMKTEIFEIFWKFWILMKFFIRFQNFHNILKFSLDVAYWINYGNCYAWSSGVIVAMEKLGFFFSKFQKLKKKNQNLWNFGYFWKILKYYENFEIL